MPAASQEAAANEGREPIIAVRIEGNCNVETAHIMRYLVTRSGMDYDRARILEDLDRLLRSKLFKTVELEVHKFGKFGKVGSGVQLTFHVFEFPNNVDEVIFRNVHHISQEDLEMTRHLVAKGLPLNPSANKAAAREIQQYLRLKGHCWADVVLEEGGFESDHRVVFNISEGQALPLGASTGTDRRPDPAIWRRRIEANRNR